MMISWQRTKSKVTAYTLGKVVGSDFYIVFCDKFSTRGQIIR